jgi:uncharacterized membrane protein SpoIIM required for sporulation
MVLESLVDAKKILDHPVKMVVASFIISIVCSFVSYFIFPAYAGVISPLLITIAIAPLMYSVFSMEEEIEEQQANQIINKTFIDRYDELIKIFAWFFLGNMLAILVMTSFLPQDILSVIFSQQLSEIAAIGNLANSVSANAISTNFLPIIIVNNLKVMAFSFLLAFLIETGGFFILSWNASILGVYLGDFIRRGAQSQFLLVSVGIFPHAIIEILAYFLAGIAGGVLSLGLVKTSPGSKEFDLIFKDAFKFLIIAFLLVIVGGLVEVYL